MNLKKFLGIIVVGFTGILLQTRMVGKTAYIFDLDDTLIRSKAKAYLFTPDNVIHSAYTSREIRDQKEMINKKIEDGYIMNFDEIGDDPMLSFHYLMTSEENVKMIEFVRRIYRRTKEDIYILTGRGNDPEIIYNFLAHRFNLIIPIENIMTVAHKPTFHKIQRRVGHLYEDHPIYSIFQLKDSPLASIHKKKKVCLFSVIMKGYDRINFYDDDKHNIDEANELKRELKEYEEFEEIEMNVEYIEDF